MQFLIRKLVLSHLSQACPSYSWDSVIIASNNVRAVIMPLSRDFQKNATHVWHSLSAAVLPRVDAGGIMPAVGCEVTECKFSNIP